MGMLRGRQELLQDLTRCRGGTGPLLCTQALAPSPMGCCELSILSAPACSEEFLILLSPSMGWTQERLAQIKGMETSECFPGSNAKCIKCKDSSSHPCLHVLWLCHHPKPFPAPAPRKCGCKEGLHPLTVPSQWSFPPCNLETALWAPSGQRMAKVFRKGWGATLWITSLPVGGYGRDASSTPDLALGSMSRLQPIILVGQGEA